MSRVPEVGGQGKFAIVVGRLVKGERSVLTYRERRGSWGAGLKGDRPGEEVKAGPLMKSSEALLTAVKEMALAITGLSFCRLESDEAILRVTL